MPQCFVGLGSNLRDRASNLRHAVTSRLLELRELNMEEGIADSPLFKLLEGYKAPDIAHLKTDSFRNRLIYSEDVKTALWEARASETVEAVKNVENRLGQLDQVEAGVVIDLFLSYRALSAWDEMPLICPE